MILNKRALLVGVDAYEFLGELKFARADAEAFADALEDLCGFDRNAIQLLTCGFRGAAKALSRSIERALADLTCEKYLDLLIFGFWGHGFRPSTDKHFLCGLDTAPDDLERSAIHLDLIKAKLCQAGARDTLILLDSCQSRPTSPDRSGETGVLEQGVMESLSGLARDISAKSSRPALTHTVAVLMACSEGQRAYEWEERGHGIFTGHLLEALEMGLLSISELTSRLADRVPGTAHRLYRAKQIPFCEIKGGKTDISLGKGADSKRGNRPHPSPPFSEKSPQKQWHWRDVLGIHGPSSFDELGELVKSGVIRGNAQIWKPSMDEWCKVTDFQVLARLMPKGVSPPPITSASLIYRAEDSRRHNIVICAGTSFGFGRDGSDPQVDVVLRPKTEKDKEAFRLISRHHFRIERDNNSWLLRLPEKAPTNELIVNDVAARDLVALDRARNTVKLTDVMELCVEYRATKSTIHLLDGKTSRSRFLVSHQSENGCCLVYHAEQGGRAKEERYVLLCQSATIGSDPRNAVHMSANGVMPLHAALVYSDQRLWIERVGNLGMVRSNDNVLRPDSRVPLSHGDRLEIGDVKARLVPKRFFDQ